MWFFFFFQAEDGIRDVAVTGVQTCALPISAGDSAGESVRVLGFGSDRAHRGRRTHHGRAAGRVPGAARVSPPRHARDEIGRASCRERGVDLGGRRIIKKKKKGSRSVRLLFI